MDEGASLAGVASGPPLLMPLLRSGEKWMTSCENPTAMHVVAEVQDTPSSSLLTFAGLGDTSRFDLTPFQDSAKVEKAAELVGYSPTAVQRMLDRHETPVNSPNLDKWSGVCSMAQPVPAARTVVAGTAINAPAAMIAVMATERIAARRVGLRAREGPAFLRRISRGRLTAFILCLGATRPVTVHPS